MKRPYEPVVMGQLLPRRVSLPCLRRADEALIFKLDNDGVWSVIPRWKDHIDQERQHARPGDTGRTTEWIVYPEWSHGFGMTIDLLPGQQLILFGEATATVASGLVLYADVTDLDTGETILDGARFWNTFLIVRQQFMRPLPAPVP